MKRLLFKNARGAVMMGITALMATTVLAGCSGEKKSAQAPAQPAVKPAEAVAINKSGDPVAGKQIYLTHCHFCHGRTGRGDGPVGIAISPHPADFVGDRKRMNKTDEELYESITQGIYKEIGGEEMAMPRWAEVLSEQERWDVLAYVRQLEREGLAADEKK